MEPRNNFEVQLGGQGAVQRKHHVLCVGKQSCMYGKDRMRTRLLGNIERTTRVHEVPGFNGIPKVRNLMSTSHLPATAF